MSLAESQVSVPIPGARKRDPGRDPSAPPEASRDPGRERERRRRREKEQRYAAVEIVATFEGGRRETVVVRRASSRRSVRDFQSKPGIQSVEQTRRLTMAEWHAHCDGPGPDRRRHGKPERAEVRERRPTAAEVLVTYRDGRQRRIVLAGAWTERARSRLLEQTRGIASADLVRDLNREEYLALKPWVRFRLNARTRPLDGPAPDKIAVPVATLSPSAPAPAAGPAPEARAPAPSGIHAWEVLIRQNGLTRIVRVVSPTEDGATGLVMGLDGVDAAVAIRPLSLAEYREAARPTP